ncbi:hypothetical protein ACIQGZ_26655 [Streptomyces sp. NPDC092296]|uniref:hypothetical protein n=1 Tax=Streptomyces sp. NPDC092296 TaxID=3366012 RepID=UPI00380F7BD9
MSRRRDAGDPGRECAAGLRQLDGYLLWHGETARAREQAEAFADRLPWLLGPQREEVVRVYTAERLETSRATIVRIADRTRQLQRQYAARYRALRLRLLALSLAAWACLGTLLGLLLPPG